MKFYSSQEIEDLVISFSEKLLPKKYWTHEAHVLVALWHNWNFELELAFDEVKRKIIAYNDFVGTKNTDSSGYHESLTRFWMFYTKGFLNKGNYGTLSEAANAFLCSEESLKNLPLSYYSGELLFSKEARLNWIDGDIRQIETEYQIKPKDVLNG